MSWWENFCWITIGGCLGHLVEIVYPTEYPSEAVLANGVVGCAALIGLIIIEIKRATTKEEEENGNA